MLNLVTAAKTRVTLAVQLGEYLDMILMHIQCNDFRQLLLMRLASIRFRNALPLTV